MPTDAPTAYAPLDHALRTLRGVGNFTGLLDYLRSFMPNSHSAARLPPLGEIDSKSICSSSMPLVILLGHEDGHDDTPVSRKFATRRIQPFLIVAPLIERSRALMPHLLSGAVTQRRLPS